MFLTKSPLAYLPLLALQPEAVLTAQHYLPGSLDSIPSKPGYFFAAQTDLVVAESTKIDSPLTWWCFEPGLGRELTRIDGNAYLVAKKV